MLRTAIFYIQQICLKIYSYIHVIIKKYKINKKIVRDD